MNTYEDLKRDVYTLTKIDLNCYKERQMKRRIDALIEKHKIKGYDNFVRELKNNKEIFDEFVSYLTINVSEFYRNPEQWKLLEDKVLPYLFDKFGKRLKIWSAACSTGDEPYSLVMLLSNFMPLGSIRITATDLDLQVMDKARVGIYNDKSLKGLPKVYQDKYFKKLNDRSFQISDEVKKCVEFSQHNLLRDQYPTGYDLIVCRNVLIYFTEEAKDVIYGKFNKALKKEGILFVGSTEQIVQPHNLGFTNFDSFFYKKV